MPRFNPQDAELSRLQRVKQQSRPPTHAPLGPEMVSFFKQSVSKRHTKLSKIAECWGALVPETLNDHCALESLSRGSLTVIVDSSSHLYELKQLLLAGLEQQLLLACKSAGLRKITLKPGRWYDEGGASGDRKLRFQ
ncbi:MAG: DciA family protein [Tepidisphaeraceae bacterium]